MKTYFAKNEDVKNDWYVIDASGKTLGRVAAKAASVLRGKHKASYTPNSMCGDFVVIVNAEKFRLQAKKLTICFIAIIQVMYVVCALIHSILLLKNILQNL